jgi:hypothetical protein
MVTASIASSWVPVSAPTPRKSILFEKLINVAH